MEVADIRLEEGGMEGDILPVEEEEDMVVDRRLLLVGDMVEAAVVEEEGVEVVHQAIITHRLEVDRSSRLIGRWMWLMRLGLRMLWRRSREI